MPRDFFSDASFGRRSATPACFFQAEDGIRDRHVTGVQTCALPILAIVFRSKWPANRTEWALVVFVGLVLFTADYGFIYWGENNGVESGLSAILFATLPLQ